MPYIFLLPLCLGFAFNLASAFTTTFSRRWGERRGALVTVLLRDVLGIPLWASGFGLAALAPAPFIIAPTLVTGLMGWGLILAGGGLILAALVTIRQRAARPALRDTLAQTGLYAYLRHPIHSGTLLELAGLALLFPSWAMLSACGLGGGWVLAQTWLEEKDLLQRLPAYRAYMARVPRFLPRWRVK